MIRSYEKIQNCGTLGFKLIGKNGKENNSYNIRFNYGILNKFLLFLCRRVGLFFRKKMYTCGADIFIKKTIFEDVGMFDENIFMYSEETDLSYRIEQIGKKVSYSKSLKIVHLQGQSSGSNAIKSLSMMLESDFYCAKKHNKNFKKMMAKEIRAMKLLNFLKIKKYNQETINFYKKYLIF